MWFPLVSCYGSSSFTCPESVNWRAYSSGSISIGKLASSKDELSNHDVWQEYVYLTDSNVVQSATALLHYCEAGEAYMHGVSPVGFFCSVIFVNNKGNPEKLISISRADSLLISKSASINKSGIITLKNNYITYESPELVGLIYGIMVRHCSGKVHKERSLFESNHRTLEEVMFDVPQKKKKGQPKKTAVCEKLFFPWNVPVGSFFMSWDILDLMTGNYPKKCKESGVACRNTVWVKNGCYKRAHVNPLLFGRVGSMCGFTKTKMTTYAGWWKATKPNDSTPEDDLPGSAKIWTAAGYDGWPSGGGTPAPERTECPECIIDGKKVESIGTSFTGHFAGVPF